MQLNVVLNDCDLKLNECSDEDAKLVSLRREYWCFNYMKQDQMYCKKLPSQTYSW